MTWWLLALLLIVVPAIINPILYFIYWELYKRKNWIREKECYERDERFWKTESYWEDDPDGLKRQYTKQILVAEIRPQVRDVWNSMECFWLWWCPIISVITTIYYVCEIITRPFEKSWKWIVRKIADIKV